MPHIITFAESGTESAADSLVGAIEAVPAFGPVADARPVTSGTTHVRLSDGAVLVVREFAPGKALAYSPAEYAMVDLSKVRDPAVRQVWDVAASWS